MMHKIAAVLVAVGASLVATPAEAASTWQAHDKNCKTVNLGVEVGSVCAEVQKRVTDSGAVTGYRGRTSVMPAPGQSITPAYYIWNSNIVEFCPGGCTPKTTAWTSAWSTVEPQTHTYVIRIDNGGYPTEVVGASWSQWYKQAGRCVTYVAGEVCVNRYERGYRTYHQERGQLQVKPASGQWLEPRWVRVGNVANGESSSKTSDLCDPTCTKRRTAWTGSVTRNFDYGYDEGFASASWVLPSGAVKSMRVTD